MMCLPLSKQNDGDCAHMIITHEHLVITIFQIYHSNNLFN